MVNLFNFILLETVLWADLIKKNILLLRAAFSKWFIQRFLCCQNLASPFTAVPLQPVETDFEELSEVQQAEEDPLAS